MKYLAKLRNKISQVFMNCAISSFTLQQYNIAEELLISTRECCFSQLRALLLPSFLTVSYTVAYIATFLHQEGRKEQKGAVRTSSITLGRLVLEATLATSEYLFIHTLFLFFFIKTKQNKNTF